MPVEVGQQKGGDFPCWVCPININSSNVVARVLYQPIIGVKERTQKVLMTNKAAQKEILWQVFACPYCPCSHVFKDDIWKINQRRRRMENIQFIENHNFNIKFSPRPCYTERYYQVSRGFQCSLPCSQ